MQRYLLSTLATSMQSSLFYYKNLYYVLLACSALFFFQSQSLGSEPFLSQAEFKGNYSSYPGLMSAPPPEPKPKIYNLYQLMNLKKALAPRYIQIFNQRQYAFTGKIIQKGIFFSYGSSLSPGVKKVSLAGNFNNWLEIPMQRNRLGIFFYILPVKADQKQRPNIYRYKFVVDGAWQHDPNNSYRASDKMGAYYSLFYLDQNPINRQASVRVYKASRKSTAYWVEFAIYLPKVRNLTLVGSFNNWNPEHDPMSAESNGMFRRRVKLEAGEYIYKFIADGKWILDKYNPNTRFDPNIQELSSFLKIP